MAAIDEGFGRIVEAVQEYLDANGDNGYSVERAVQMGREAYRKAHEERAFAYDGD